MPKLIITLTEVTTPDPDDTEKNLRGFETHIEGFYDDMPIEESILARLVKPIDAAISQVFHDALGCPIYKGQGPIDQVSQEELAQGIGKSAFPSEL